MNTTTAAVTGEVKGSVAGPGPAIARMVRREWELCEWLQIDGGWIGCRIGSADWLVRDAVTYVEFMRLGAAPTAKTIKVYQDRGRKGACTCSTRGACVHQAISAEIMKGW